MGQWRHSCGILEKASEEWNGEEMMSEREGREAFPSAGREGGTGVAGEGVIGGREEPWVSLIGVCVEEEGATTEAVWARALGRGDWGASGASSISVSPAASEEGAGPRSESAKAWLKRTELSGRKCTAGTVVFGRLKLECVTPTAEWAQGEERRGREW